MSNSAEKIKVKCDECQKTIRAPAKMVGKSAKCPNCGCRISILPMAGASSPKLVTQGERTAATPAPQKTTVINSRAAVSKQPTRSSEASRVSSGSPAAKPALVEKVEVTCGQCEKTIQAPVKWVGKSAKCPGCGCRISILPNSSAKTVTPVEGTNDARSVAEPTPAPQENAVSNLVAADSAKGKPTSEDSPVPLSSPAAKSAPVEKIKVTCDHCDKTIRAPAKLVGKSAKCPNCSNRISILPSSSTKEVPNVKEVAPSDPTPSDPTPAAVATSAVLENVVSDSTDTMSAEPTRPSEFSEAPRDVQSKSRSAKSKSRSEPAAGARKVGVSRTALAFVLMLAAAMAYFVFLAPDSPSKKEAGSAPVVTNVADAPDVVDAPVVPEEVKVPDVISAPDVPEVAKVIEVPDVSEVPEPVSEAVIRLKQLSGQELVRQCIAQIGAGVQQMDFAYETLRVLDPEPEYRDEMVQAVTEKVSNYLQEPLKNSNDHNAMISLAAILLKWDSPERSLPLANSAVKHSGTFSKSELDQQMKDILEFAAESKTPAAAEVLVSLLPYNLLSKHAGLLQSIESCGGNAKSAVLPLLTTGRLSERRFAQDFFDRYGEVDQETLLKQLLTSRGFEVFEKVKSIEIEPANQAFVLKEIIDRELVYDLKDVYLKYAGKEELSNLKEIASRADALCYRAMKRLIELDGVEGTETLKAIYLKDKSAVPYYQIEKAVDASFEPALLGLLAVSETEPIDNLIETLGAIGTTNSIAPLRAFIAKLQAENPDDSLQELHNSGVIKGAQIAIGKIQSRR